METMILNHLYCTSIINSVKKKETGCDNFQQTNSSNKVYGETIYILSENAME